MGFEQIIGQRRAIEDLQAAFRRGRVPSAYLFAGPRGVGKATTAMILARLLNCQGVRADIQPCDICNSCRKITHGNHSDIWIVEAVKSTIKIDQVREMQRLVRFPPQEAKVRVVLVDGVEGMNPESANAFLKTLEEPPPNNLFVLITSSASQLLPTIISRCQRVPFAPLQRDDLAALLAERHGFDTVRASLAAGIAEGSVGKALELDGMLATDERREFLQALPTLHKLPQGAIVAMELAEKLAKDAGQISIYLTLLRIWLRDLLFLREVPGASERVISLDLLGPLQEHAAILPTSSVIELIREVERAEAALRGNAATQLTLEQLFLTMGRASSFA